MYVVFTKRDLDTIPANQMFVLLGKLVDITKRKNYSLVKVSLLDSLENFYYFKDLPIIYSTILLIGRKINRGDRTFLRAIYITELSILEELYWRYILLENLLSNKVKTINTKHAKESIKPQQSISGGYKDSTTKEKINNYLIEQGFSKEERESYLIERELSRVDVMDKNKMRKMILSAIDNLDKGDGVSIDDISKYIGISKSVLEEIISELLMMGELYEYKPGKLKLLK